MSFGRAFTIVAVALGAIAVVLGVVCGVLVINTRTFLAESSIARGEVVELVPRQSCEDHDNGERECHTVYAPRVRFAAGDGRQVVFDSPTAAAPPDYAEGDRVDVRYRPERPAEARIDSLSGVWLGPMITGGLAAVFAIMCGIWIVLAVRFRHT